MADTNNQIPLPGYTKVDYDKIPEQLRPSFNRPDAEYFRHKDLGYVQRIKAPDPRYNVLTGRPNSNIFPTYNGYMYIPLRGNSPVWQAPTARSRNLRPITYTHDSKGNITGQRLGKSQAQLDLARQRKKDIMDTLAGLKYLRPSDLILGAKVGGNATMAGAASGAYDIGNFTNNFILRPITSMAANVSDTIVGPTNTSAAIRNVPNTISTAIKDADTASEQYYDNKLKDITKGTVLEGYNDNYSRILGGSGLHILAGAGNLPGLSGSAYKYGGTALQHAVMPGHKYIVGAMYRPFANYIARMYNVNPIIAGQKANQIYNNMMQVDRLGRIAYMTNEFGAKPVLKVLNGYTEGNNPYVQAAIQGSKALDVASPVLSPAVVAQKTINVTADRQGAFGSTIGTVGGKYLSEPAQDFMADMIRTGRISKEQAEEIARTASEWGKGYYKNNEDKLIAAGQKAKERIENASKELDGKVPQDMMDIVKTPPTDVDSVKDKLNAVSENIPKTPEDARKIAIEAIKQGLMEIPEVRRAMAIYNGFNAANTTTDAGILKLIKQNAPGTNKNLLAAAGDSASEYFKDFTHNLEAAAQDRLNEYLTRKGISYDDILNGKVRIQQVVSDVLSGQ